ncbi:MAG: DUF1192 domain-containing protein [Alphaproteobacteria bacterium]
MDTDDIEPGSGTRPRDLESMSIEALNQYVSDLKAEIARVQAAIAAKRDVRQGADALFRKR